MRGLCVILGVIIILASIPIANTSTPTQHLKWQIIFSTPTISIDGNCLEVSVDNCLYLSGIGIPKLPVKKYTFKYPVNTVIKSVLLKNVEFGTMKLQHKLKLADTPMRINNDKSLTEQSYLRYNQYPPELFQYHTGCGLDPTTDERILFLSVSVYPVIYYPQMNTLKYIKYGELDITYISAPSSTPTHTLSVSTNGLRDVYEVVYIIPKDFSSAIQPLIDHKNNRSVKAKAVTLDDIYNGVYFPVQGRDDPEKIKYFIKNAVEHWYIKYVVLCGDTNKMPLRYARMPVNDMDGYDIPSDLYFADIYKSDGTFTDWNANNNNYWGEFSSTDYLIDGQDLYPDVYIGRVPAGSESSMKGIVNKIIKYEKNTDWTTWFKNAVLCGTDTFGEAPGPESEYSLDMIEKRYLTPMGFKSIKLYATQGTLSASAMKSNIEKGCGFLSLSDHGSFSGWAGLWGISNTDSLSHGEKLPFVVIAACQCGGFDKDCLAEHFVTNPNGGGIGVIAASRTAWGEGGKSWIRYQSGYMEQTTYKAYYDGIRAQGRIRAKSLVDYLNDLGVTPAPGVDKKSAHVDYKTIVEYNLLGDPSVEIGGVNKNDVGVDFLSPKVGGSAGTYKIDATVKNFGNNSQQPFDVQCDIYKLGFSTVFADDVEGPDPGWTPAGSWKRGQPTVGPKPHSGSKCFGTNLDGNYPDNADESLATPSINLPNDAIFANFTFWQWYKTESKGNEAVDGGLVEISVDGGTTWEILEPEESYPTWIQYSGKNKAFEGGTHVYGCTRDQWTFTVFDLTLYIGKTIKLRYHFGSDNKNNMEGWYIDDVSINVRPGTSVYSNVKKTVGTMKYMDQQNVTWGYGFADSGDYYIRVSTKLQNDECKVNDWKDVVITITGGNVGWIKGTVKDKSNNNPIEGASIKAGGYSAVTDSNGKYNISVSPGKYDVTASKVGYKSETKPADVPVNQTVALDFLLEAIPNAGYINGTVKDATNNNPIAGAEISAGSYTTATDASGKYTLTVQAGTYDVKASKSGYNPQTKTVTVNAGQSVDVDFLLMPIQNIAFIIGTVTDSTNNNPIEGCLIEAGIYNTTTNSVGKYNLTIQAGSYDVKASKSGYNPQTKTVTVSAGETKTLDFQLEPQKGLITGRVTDADTNMPIQDATVEDNANHSTTTDSSGKYSLEVPPGTYNVKASKSGYDSQTKQVTVSVGETKIVDFKLNKSVKPEGWLTGSVKDSKSLAPIKDAEIKTGTYSTTTNASGEYKLSLPAGDYEVTISAKNYESQTKKVKIESGKVTTLHVLLVSKSVLGGVDIKPKDVTLKIGETQKFEATAYDENNNVIEEEVTFAWTLEGSVGKIDKTSGKETTFTATAEGNGTLKVTAEYKGMKKYAKVTITVKKTEMPEKKERFPITVIGITVGIITAVVCIVIALVLWGRRKKKYSYPQPYFPPPPLGR